MTVHKQTLATVSAPRAKGDEPSMLITTIRLDRDGDVAVPEGAIVDAYMRNPSVGFYHFRADPMPVGSTVRLDIEPGYGIRATWRWLENDPLADRVRNAYEQGVLRAASIGFIPREWTEIRETGGRRYTKWELIEWSLVAVPANPDAVRTLKSLSLWQDDGGTRSRGDGPVLEITDEPGLEVADDVLRWWRDLEARAHLHPARQAGLLGEATVVVDRSEVVAACHQVIPRLWRNEVHRQAQRELNQLRGRLD